MENRVLDDKIRAAYDQMDPTSEQEERMLAKLLASQAEAGESGESAGMPVAAASALAVPAGAPATVGTFATAPVTAPVAPATEAQAGAQGVSAADVLSSVSPAKQQPVNAAPKRSGVRPWKVALPLAACFALMAVLVGVTLGNPVEEASTAPVSDGSRSEAKSERSETQAPQGLYAQDMATEEGYMPGSDSGEIAPGPEPGSPFNTEEYAAVDENGFVNTRTQPLSTVSADVDTASYCNVRRMINSGYDLADIPSGAVRAEEMVNYFTYDYAEPKGKDLFSMQAQASECPWNEDTQLLVMGFATRSERGAADKGANLVFLIDVSGSMASPDKLDLLKESFKKLVDNLDENDRVSIVTYSGSEEVVLEGARGNERSRILKAINGLRASGSTNGEAGLRMAYEVAESNFIEGGVNRIVMASDGDLNVGMTSTSDLYDFVEGKRGTGVYLSVLGFGTGNYKDTKMEVLADHGNGSYHYIDCVSEAERVFSERLMANLVPFADDVKVQVEFNPAQVKAYRLVGYENRKLNAEDFTDDAVDAGDVGPNAQFTLIYEVVLSDSAYEAPEVRDLKYGAGEYAGSSSSDWLTCALRYRAFSDDAVHEQELVVNAGNSTSKPSADWKFASAVAEFAMLASSSDYLGTASLDDVLDRLDTMDLNEERAGFRDLLEAL